MISYATVDGILRECSNILVTEVKDGTAKLTQFVSSIQGDRSWDEKRYAETKALDGEGIMEVVERINGNHTTVITSDGKLAKLVPVAIG